MQKWLKIIFITTIFWLPLVSHAQINSGSFINYADELNVEINPNYPRPGENVNINLTMYTEDLNSSEISWFVNGKLELKAIGRKNFSVTTPQTGERLS